MHSASPDLSNNVAALDHESLSLLLKKHSRRLYSFVRRRVRNPADVEDLVQETCVEALRCLSRFQGHSRPETWLFGIAMNLVRSHYKTTRAHDVFDYAEENEDEKHPIAEDTLDTVERYQMLARVDAVLKELPEDTRQLLQLVFDDNCSYEEAAEILGIPLGTVRSRLSRARALIKKSVH